MAQIKIRRGTAAELAGITLAIGEIGYCTDTKQYYIGNGVSNTWIASPVLDQDDMASDSDTSLATQQSIKKYVDDNVGGTSADTFYEGDILITSDYTITAGKNAMTPGPVEIDAGVTITVPQGSMWTVV
jgi:hypothetical protein